MSYKQAEQTLLMYQIDRIEYLIRDLDEDIRREINDRLSAISSVELAWGSAMAMDYGVYKKIISREQADELSKSIGHGWSPMASNFYELHRDNISVESFEDTGLPVEMNPYIDKDNTIALYPTREEK